MKRDRLAALPTIRRATAADQATIREIVRAAELDPFKLDWPNFLLAELDGQIAGIGQIRPYPNCPELGSIVTLPEYRGQGIAARIIETLLDGQTDTIYLECAGRMASFYIRFGFREIPWWQAPMPLKLKAGLGNVIGRLGGWHIAVMKRDGVQQDHTYRSGIEGIGMEANREEAYVTGIARLFPQQGRWTEVDYFALPETNQIVELANGELIVTPSPLDEHQSAVGQLFIALSLHVDARSLGIVRIAPYDVHLFEGTIRQPDVLFLREENRQRNNGKYIEGPPDWVAEVISPGTRHTDEVDKPAEYAKAGVSEYWLVDPENRSIHVYALRGAPAYTLAGTYTPGQIARSETLVGFEVAVDRVV